MKSSWWVFMAALGAAPSARAAPVEGGIERSAPSEVVVVLRSDSGEVSEPELLSAVAAELGASCVGPEDPRASRIARVLTVTHRSAARELAVTFSEPGRASVTRVITAPDSPSRVISAAALLAGNLARNDTAEFGAEPESAKEAAPREPVLPAPTVAAAPATQTEAPATTRFVPRPEAPRRSLASASFFYPLATNYDEPEIETNFDFNLLYGRVGKLDGVALGMVNVVQRDFQGLAMGAANVVGKSESGVVVGAIFNRAEQVIGLQLGGIANLAQGTLDGGQISTVMNAAGDNSRGLQVAAGMNLSRGFDGLQAAFVSNVSAGAVTGAQLSAGVNYAGDVSGLQLGLVNVGKRVRGMQIGLFNVADDVEGVPIGLVSVTRTGGVHPMLWGSTSSYANVGIKFATRYTYTFVNLSLHSEAGREQMGPGFGLGATVPLFSKLLAGIDVGGTHLFGGTACCQDAFFGANARQKDATLFKLRGLLRYAFLPHLSAFGGVGMVTKLTYPLDDDGDTVVHGSLGPEGILGVEL